MTCVECGAEMGAPNVCAKCGAPVPVSLLDKVDDRTSWAGTQASSQPGTDAGTQPFKRFTGRFAGRLGVGIAILVILVVGIVLAVAHPHSNAGSASAEQAAQRLCSRVGGQLAVGIADAYDCEFVPYYGSDGQVYAGERLQVDLSADSLMTDVTNADGLSATPSECASGHYPGFGAGPGRVS